MLGSAGHTIKNKIIMIEFDIDELREKIKGFSYENNLSFLENKEASPIVQR